MSRIISLVILLLIPVTWWLTIASWEAEIAGVYSYSRAVFNILATAAGLSAIYILTGKNDRKHRIQMVVLVGATAGFCLLILEVPAIVFGFNYQKVFATSGPETALHLSGGVNKPDPELIHIHWPHSSFNGEVAGNLVSLGIPTPNRYPVNVRYDHNGFRNDHDYEQADIAVIGDSFIEAAIIPREKSLAGQLESRMAMPVVNLGQIAYGFRQEMEVLKRFALPLSPRLVIWAVFGGNDLRDVETYEMQRSRFGEPAAELPLKQRLFTRNLLVAVGNALTGILRTNMNMPSEKALDHSGLFIRADGETERVYFGQTADPWNDHQWNVAVETLVEANHLSRENGTEFVIVYIPRKFRIYKDHLTLSADTGIAGWEVNDLPDVLAKWSRDSGIHFVDTTPYLARQVAAGVHPYFIDDVHWNTLGHATAAEAIAEYLSRNAIFPFNTNQE